MALDVLRLKKSSLARPGGVLAICFAAVLLTPLVAGLFGMTGATALVEKRKPAPLPKTPRTLALLSLYPSRLSTYAGDNFPFRSQLVSYNSLLRSWLHSSSNREVVFGKDGWIFLAKTFQSVDILDQNRGVAVFSPKELNAWVREMEARTRWCTERGIAFYVTVPPNTHTIYPQFLPDYARQVGRETPLQQVIRRLRERNSPIRFIDLREGVTKAAEHERIYYKTDSHWNNLGAFAGYTLIAERMRLDFPAIQPLTRDMYDVQWKTDPGYGLAEMLNLQDFIQEEAPYLVPKFSTPITSLESSDGKPPVLQRGMEGPHPAPGGDATTNRTDQPKIFMLGDSFIDWMSIYFAETFAQTTIRKHRGGQFYFCKEEIERAKPDIILYEIVERHLTLPLETASDKKAKKSKPSTKQAAPE